MRERTPEERVRSAIWSIESQTHKASRAEDSKHLRYHLRNARAKLAELEQLTLDRLAAAQADHDQEEP